MTTSRRGTGDARARSGRGGGIGVGALARRTRLDLFERAAVLNGTPVAVGGVGGRALSGGVDVAALEATVSERVAEILRERKAAEFPAEAATGTRLRW